jgi:hypothetical protein
MTRLGRHHLRYPAQAGPDKMAWRHHCAGHQEDQ